MVPVPRLVQLAPSYENHSKSTCSRSPSGSYQPEEETVSESPVIGLVGVTLQPVILGAEFPMVTAATTVGPSDSLSFGVIVTAQYSLVSVRAEAMVELAWGVDPPSFVHS